MIKLVHIDYEKYDIYIGRENKSKDLPDSKWRNPFVIDKHGTREKVIVLYEEYIIQSPNLMADLHELDGKILGCYCKKPGNELPCHGDVLIKLRKEQKKSINTYKILAVIGSRGLDNYNYVKRIIAEHNPKMLVSGGAKGIDSLAYKAAQELGLSILIHFPDWKLGLGAGFYRNTKIIESAEEVLAFQLNKSKGTQDSIDKAKKLGKKVYLHEFNSEKEEKSEDFGF